MLKTGIGVADSQMPLYSKILGRNQIAKSVEACIEEGLLRSGNVKLVFL